MKINILEPGIYNRIAAGEVVENPASVVKELVENSIDAGATRISVSIEQGGIKSIEITDDGCGIEKAELRKTILPHATSKISTAEDLYSIATLGFRGEALASIAAVSEIEIKSRYYESDSGAKLCAKGGENVNVTDIAYNQGTSILINSLFYNTPVRYKFLKPAKTEEANVTKTVTQLILANPSVAFNYEYDGKQVYSSDGSGLENAVKAVYSSEIFNNLLPIESDPELPIRLSGYVSKPSHTKNNRTFQTLILNGRVVSDPGVSGAVQNAYGERLMHHSFPVFVINMILRFDEVDVNVHPNKREVRFANPRQVAGAVFNAVKSGLEVFENTKRAEFDRQVSVTALPQSSDSISKEPNPKVLDNTKIDPTRPPYEQTEKPAYSAPIIDRNPLSVSFFLDKLDQNKSETAAAVLSDSAVSLPIFDVFEPKRPIGETSAVAKIPQTEEVDAHPFIIPNREGVCTTQPDEFLREPDRFKILGQVFDTYLAVESEGKLYLIDQHAAHERLLYDNLKMQFERGNPASQPLLIPYIYEDSPARIAEILALSPEIAKFGFEIEAFGNDTVKVSAIPAVLTDADPSDFIGALIENLRSGEFSQAELLRDKLMRIACKSAIKGGYSYSKTQTETVVRYFFESGMPLQCPHGRPAYISFTQTELEKLFRRKV